MKEKKDVNESFVSISFHLHLPRHFSLHGYFLRALAVSSTFAGMGCRTTISVANSDRHRKWLPAQEPVEAVICRPWLPAVQHKDIGVGKPWGNHFPIEKAFISLLTFSDSERDVLTVAGQWHSNSRQQQSNYYRDC